MVLIETKVNKKLKLAASKESLLFYVKVMIYVAAAFVATGVIILISEMDFVVGLALVIAGVLVPFFILLLTYYSIAKKIKREQEKESVQTIEFADKIVLSESSELFTANKNEIDYALIVKAKETKDYFVLFLNAFALILADKNGFKEGSVEELRTLLKSKLDKKFKPLKV